MGQGLLHLDLCLLESNMEIQYVPKQKVLQKGMRLIQKSKRSLYLTMIMKLELRTTRKEYVDLIKRKISQGIVIKRIGFCTKREYEEAKKQMDLVFSPRNFQFKYFTKGRVQRMLIADKKEMLFAICSKRERHVFFTKDALIIKSFLKLFDSIYSRAII